MLKDKTSELIAEAKELMNLCVKQIDIGDIKYMDTASFEALKKCIKLVDAACELSIEQAKMMDEFNDKLDRVLTILEKAES